MTLGQRLKDARQAAGLTQTQLAIKAGVDQTTISKIEKGLISHTTEILALARGTNVNPDWLEREVGPRERGAKSEVELGGTTYPAIRRVALKVTAGISGFAIEPLEGDEEPIAFRADWFLKRGYKPEALYAIEVRGSSMEPGLHEGDTVVINTADRQPADGEVYAINYEGELVVKRLLRMGPAWLASSDHMDKRRHPDRPMHEGAFLVGRVVHKQSERV